jgi:signal transduction histidine kinase/ActR/RegA family two-component response regulator
MGGPPSTGAGEREGRLQRCIRDLAALNALPSMCVGRSPEEALDIVLDALPTALDCELVYFQLPGSPTTERATLRGAPLSAAELADVRVVMACESDGADAQIFLAGGALWCLEAEIPIGTERGRLLAGRSASLHPDIDRVLVRTAANVVGTTLETAQVLEVARRKDDFLAMLGHELRNPLAPILTAVELLAREPAAAREREVIERHTRHMARLVDDLLDISRVTRGHIELRNEQVSLASVLERAVEIAAPVVARHRHDLQVAPAEQVTLMGDPVRLAQIFGNLLTNAAKFTPPGGTVKVQIESTPGRVRVTVRDNGVGIAPSQLGRIFEPFVQADREQDALRGGLGLGLAIVKNLVERHQGTISVQSGGRGQGAAFTVDLPTVAQAEPPAVETVPPDGSLARAGLRVLVVDDNVDIAELLAEALAGEGFQTAVAHDARSALVRWRSFSPQAAILDVGMPDVDGYELARALRTEHGRSATLIAVTGYGQARDRMRAAEAGFDRHLVKPVSIQDLVLLLDQHVVLASARDQPPSGSRPRSDG